MGDDKRRRREKLVGDFAYFSHKIRSHKREKNYFFRGSVEFTLSLCPPSYSISRLKYVARAPKAWAS